MGAMYKAAVWVGNRKLEIMEKPIPVLGSGKILLKVGAAGICGTDLHILSGKHPGARPPLVLGHEFAGVVADVGSGVDKKLIGTRVGSDSYVGCGECVYCLSGRTQLCIKGTVELGINIDGGWAEYVVVPKENIYLLPENVSFIVAGAGCILNCPPAAVEKVRIDMGDTVLIIGDGPSSLVMVQLARLKGASRIIVSGHRKRRLALSLELGADQAVDTGVENLEDVIKKLPGAPQVIIDAVGKSESFAAALALAGRGSRIHLFGLPEEPMSGIPMDMFLWKEISLTGSTGLPTLWSTTMELISRGHIRVEPIISHRFSIEKAQEALEFIYNNPKGIVKAVFDMDYKS
jgi:Threonine dehydrogenase and related Zn-dependent dehydrogenases